MTNNYRLPAQCCANCDHSYMSIYGDAQCKKLPAGNTINAGAICDLWYGHPATVDVTPGVVFKQPWVNSNECKACLYFMQPDICIQTGKNADKVCKKYENVKTTQEAEV
jgi:hypothetical protein